MEIFVGIIFLLFQNGIEKTKYYNSIQIQYDVISNNSIQFSPIKKTHLAYKSSNEELWKSVRPTPP
jgi:hypothetical protein